MPANFLHVIPRGKFSVYGDDVVAMMDAMHEMLKKAGININAPENLIVVSQGSHKSMHMRDYITNIYRIMMQAKSNEKEDVLEALYYARLYAASKDQYANGW